MGTRDAVRFAVWVAAILISAHFSSAQDTPIGDVARAARAQKAQAPRTTKVVTNDELGPQLGPVAETDDPAEVVNKASRALRADTAHTCRQEVSNNSGRGSFAESIREIAGPDRTHIVINRRGLDTARIELIIIGTDVYSRNGNGLWARNSASEFGGPMPLNPLPEALQIVYSSGGLKLLRREIVNGSPTFLYEDKFHPGGVSNRDRTIDIWIGANDGLPRRVEMTTTEKTASFIATTVDRDTTTCSYGPVPEIKPPL